MPREGPLPLSFAQERLWFLEQLEPGLAVYNLPWAVRLRGPLDLGALRAALAAVVARHEVLRTVYVAVDGVPRQVIRPALPFELPVLDLRGAGPQRCEPEAMTVITDAAARPFDLERDAMLRGLVVQVGEREAFLLLVVHHIASDGWSWNVFLRELASVYGGLVAGPPATLPPLPIQYADFAAWQRARLEAGGGDLDLAYWRAKLAGLPPSLDLPADRPRPLVADYGGDQVPFAFPPSLSARLASIERAERVTRFQLLVAALFTLLHRLTGEEAVAVGTPMHGRLRWEVEGLIGFFVNTIVLRGDLHGDPTFRTLLRSVRETCLAALDHQELPFERLIADLRPERVRSQTPLFQVMFTHQSWSGTPPVLPGLTVEPVPVTTKTAKFDLRLEVAGQGGSITGCLEYRTSMFDRWRAGSLVRQLRTMLEGIAADPDRRVGRLPLLTGRERARLARLGAGAGHPAPDAVVHAAFEDVARRRPDAPAVVAEGASVSYGEIERRANRLSRALVERGVLPGTRVGICMGRSVETLVAALAVLKAGAAYVPLEPSWPAGRLRTILADADPVLVVTLERWRPDLPDGAWPVLVADREPLGAPADAPPAVAVWPSDVAYVIYTSGSTGAPKGVLVEHRSVVNYVAALRERIALPADASFAWLQPLAVDSSVTTIYGALCAGGCVHVLTEDEAVDPRAVAERFTAERIDVLKIAPTHLAALHGGGEPARLLPRRCLIIGGEPSAGAWVASLRALAPRLAIYNHYGPTETTVGVTMHRVPARLGRTVPEPLPIGRPLANVELRVLDRNREAVALGFPGELWVGGACLARGYHGRDELTAERFVSLADGAGGARRLYRTGDRVRFLPGGDLVFLGRTDGQVKIRGFRVEPGEVERALRSLPGVAEAVVLARDVAGTDRRLVAYVVPRAGEEASVEAIRAGLAAILPDHMLPSRLVVLERLPRTAHGKLDLRALAAPEPARVAAGRDFVPPGSALERGLAVIWREVLGVERVGAGDSFFDLGGHSLLAMRVVARANAELGVRLFVRDLFDRRTLADLARAVEERGRPA